MSLPFAMQGKAFFDDPYSVYAQLREQPEPVFDERTNSWLISRFADVESVLRDPRISKKIQRAEATVFETSVLFRDPPDHGRIRGLLNRAFAGTPEDLEARVVRIADELIDRMLLQRQADFIRDFALPLPVAVIADLLGVPQADTRALHSWSSDFILDDNVPQEERNHRQFAAISGMEQYFRGLIAEGTVGGMIGALLRRDPSGDRLTPDELVGNSILLMIAGHETTVNLLGNGLYLLLDKPERLQQLRRDLGLMPSAIEEMLRFESPVQLGTFRVASEPVEIGGRVIEAHSMISAIIGSANRDAAAFTNPDVFDLARSPNRHLGFGFGPHRCIGAQLARTEARVGFTRLIERLPELHLQTVHPNWLESVLQRVGMGRAEISRRPVWREVMVTRGLRELLIRY